MTAQTAASAAYIVAALLFILALAGLSRHETARFGNTFGIAGMAIALVATLVLAISGGFTALQVGLLIGAMVIGAAIGLYRAARVPMTGMPELIALFHSFVGLAAVLVGWNGYLEVEAATGGGGVDPALLGIHHAEVVIGVFIGAVTFTGSIVAWGKLSARFKSAPAGAARQELPEPGRAGRVRRAHGVVRHRPHPRRADRGHRHRAAAGRAPGRLDRRRGHAGGRVDAQQLLRVGRGRVGVPARQRPADHHRRAGRLVGCVPVLHHVQGDEPLVPLGDRGRVRHRGPLGQRDRLRRAPRGQRRGGRRDPRRALRV